MLKHRKIQVEDLELETPTHCSVPKGSSNLFIDSLIDI